MDREVATCRCRFCGRVWRVLAEEYGDHECGCGGQREEEEDDDDEDDDADRHRTDTESDTRA